MLRFEAALARAEAAVGIVPAEAAAAIAAVCRDWDGDVEAIFVAAAETMTPVVPLLADLRSHLPEETGAWLHFGATSQDAVDTLLLSSSDASWSC